VILIAGCGNSATSPTAIVPPPTVSASTRFVDPNFHFSFAYPANWSVNKKGGQEKTVTAGYKQYALDVKLPTNAAQLSITVDGNVQTFPQFTNGHHGTIPGDPHDYVYFHDKLSGWPAMRIKRYTGKQITEIDTIANTRTRSYDVRMLTATPPFSPDSLAGYETIVHTMKVPFS
jgi:hypothetical protein